MLNGRWNAKVIFFSLIREILIGIGLYFICRSFIPRLRPDIWTALETNECVKRIPDRAATTSNCTPPPPPPPLLISFSSSGFFSSSLYPRLALFPVTSRVLCHSIFTHGYSPSYLVDVVDGYPPGSAINFCIPRVILQNITRNSWAIASEKAFRNIVSILKFRIVVPGCVRCVYLNFFRD